MSPGRFWLVAAAVGATALAGCRTLPAPTRAAPKAGDDIIVAGQRISTGTRIITWMDQGGYNAYAGKPPPELRQNALSSREKERVKKNGWDLATLQKTVDQFVLHYDACGLSKVCFNVLQQRKLSVHFLLDVDGTVYQTLDLQERAPHATTSNDRSIGIEIANLGAYARNDTKLLDEWYQRDATGQIRLKVPARIRDPGIFTPNFTGRPARPTLIRGRLQGEELVQYDFTPEQYAALIKLTATLCRIFPQIKCDHPRDGAGRLITRKLPDDALARYQGVLGHYHIQENKSDPGPALQWHTLIEGARQQMK